MKPVLAKIVPRAPSAVVDTAAVMVVVDVVAIAVSVANVATKKPLRGFPKSGSGSVCLAHRASAFKA